LVRILLIFCFLNLFAVKSKCQCTYSNSTFKSGEEAFYNVYYKLGFLWFNAAEVNFKVNKVKYKERDVFHFSSYGQTLPNYDWIYKVRDSFKSYADSVNLSPLYFTRSTSEGSYKVNNNYTFDYYNQKIYSHIANSKTPQYNDTLKIQDCTLDVLTACYASRNVDITGMSFSDTIPLKMLIDNKIYNLYLRYLGDEEVVLNNEEKYRCKKFTILMVEGTIFSGGEDIIVWISNDKAKVPVRVEAKVLVGSIIAELKSVKGNKWPLYSKTTDEAIIR